ncbi:MAG TPA: hypothetical protein VM733_01935, partial [Thermoanaerobaculia bacterium]|nr:hypothetical protein [Thermoanaerobaculia bacterium]
LRAAGYVYNFDRLAYYNRAAKKAFSLEWVEDHSDTELREALEKANDSGNWEVFVEPRPSQRVISEFLAEIGAS